MKHPKNRGVFITFEGGEGAGKTTLIDSLSAEFKNCIQTREPGGTRLGQEIRRLLLEEKTSIISKRAELLLFLADRAQHVDSVIVPALEKGQHVFCDRFNDSTLAYQGGARGGDFAWIAKLCNFSAGGLQPDLTFYLDLDPRIGLKRTQTARGGCDRIEAEAIAFHEAIRSAFLAIAKEEQGRFFVIDASLPKEEVFQIAKQKIHTLLQ